MHFYSQACARYIKTCLPVRKKKSAAINLSQPLKTNQGVGFLRYLLVQMHTRAITPSAAHLVLSPTIAYPVLYFGPGSQTEL